jgi:hypothetical protein
MMMAKPLHGFGWGQAEQVYSKDYRAARLEEAAAIQMNDYLMIGISAGVPALGCLVTYFGLLLRRSVVGRASSRADSSATSAGHPDSRSAKHGLRLTQFVSPVTRHPSLAPTCFGGALVLLIGFWFDGGMFKLPTAVVFWVLLELAREGFLTANSAQSEGRAALLRRLAEQQLGPTGHPGASRCLPPDGGASVCARQLVSSLAPPAPSAAHGMTRSPIALRWLASLGALVALALTALHLITPQLAVSERTLAVARKFLVPPAEQTDFAYLAAKPIWAGVPLKTLLQHAHLAHYNRTLVNWKLEDEMYRDFVLSPEIVHPQLPAPRLATTLAPSDGERAGVRGLAGPTNHPSTLSTLNVPHSTDLNWRRELWEYFYPRIRRESTPGAASEIVLRAVREKVSKDAASHPESILESWRRGQATALGRARLEVAALRSVGIPARLNQSDRAEFWNGTAWVE